MTLGMHLQVKPESLRRGGGGGEQWRKRDVVCPGLQGVSLEKEKCGERAPVVSLTQLGGHSRKLAPGKYRARGEAPRNAG